MKTLKELQNIKPLPYQETSLATYWYDKAEMDTFIALLYGQIMERDRLLAIVKTTLEQIGSNA